MSVTLHGSGGWCELCYGVSFNISEMTCEKVINGDAVFKANNEGYQVVAGIGRNNEKGIMWAWYCKPFNGSTPVYVDDGVVSYISFKINENAATGDIYPVKMLSENNGINQVITTVDGTGSCSLIDGAIIIKDDVITTTRATTTSEPVTTTRATTTTTTTTTINTNCCSGEDIQGIKWSMTLTKSEAGVTGDLSVQRVYLKDSTGNLHVIADGEPLDYLSSIKAVSEWNLTLLGDMSFYNCPKLKNMFVPGNVNPFTSYTGKYAIGYYTKQLENTTRTEQVEDFILYGWSGSSAADYANELGFRMIFAEGLPTGNINGDKAVDVSDASIVLNLYASQAAGLDISKYTQQQITATDVDGDGKISTSDASYILTYYAQFGAGLDPLWEQILGK